MDVKPGFKQSEVGVIPGDWGVKTLDRLFTFQNGVNATKESYGTGVPFINVLEIVTYPFLDDAQIPGRVSLTESQAQHFSVLQGDLLFNRTSETLEEVGLASTYLGSERTVFGGFVIRARIKSAEHSSTYLTYSLRSPALRGQISSRGQGAVRANIGQSDLARIHIPLPGRAEQEAIADALSDADALIESLERLIAKKRQIKQGAMQELLTGRTRLPGFEVQPGYKSSEVGTIPVDWEVRELGSLGPVVTGSTPPTRDPRNYGFDFLFVSPADISPGKYVTGTQTKLSARGWSLARHFPENSILFVCIGSTIGKCGMASVEVTANQQINAVLPSEMVCAHFLYFALSLRSKAVRSSAAEQAVPIVNKSSFSRTPIALPVLQPEQEAIAEVLTNMEDEITALERKREKARRVKQGMMQELLTGRIRLL